MCIKSAHKAMGSQPEYSKILTIQLEEQNRNCITFDNSLTFDSISLIMPPDCFK